MGEFGFQSKKEESKITNKRPKDDTKRKTYREKSDAHKRKFETNDIKSESDMIFSMFKDSKMESNMKQGDDRISEEKLSQLQK